MSTIREKLILKKLKMGIIVFLLVFSSQLEAADILYLKDGTQIEGKYMEYRLVTNEIVFLTRDGTVLKLQITSDVTIVDKVVDEAGNLIFDAGKKQNQRNAFIQVAFIIIVIGSTLLAALAGGQGDDGPPDVVPPVPE